MNQATNKPHTQIDFSALEEGMISCEQTSGMNMLQHGLMIEDYYKDIFYHLKFGANLRHEWKIPPVLIENAKAFCASALLPDEAALYHIYHDNGKHLCRTIDQNGRQHFPNHAQASYDNWMKHGGDEEIGWYILHDMHLHTLRGDELKEFISSNRARIPTLLLTAWSEIHANSTMFGGIESTSFKIKHKQLEKITKQYFKGEQND